MAFMSKVLSMVTCEVQTSFGKVNLFCLTLIGEVGMERYIIPHGGLLMSCWWIETVTIRITKEGTIMVVLSGLGIVGNVFKKSDSPCSLTIVIRTLMDPKMRSLATIAA